MVHYIKTTLDDWNINPKEIQLDNIIGSGAFAEVFKGTWRGTPVAVKIIKIAESEKDLILSQCEKEMNILM